MKSKIRFEANMSKETVNFLDVQVSIQGKELKTALYSKPTDAHLYLNAKSSHPTHVKNWQYPLLYKFWKPEKAPSSF